MVYVMTINTQACVIRLQESKRVDFLRESSLDVVHQGKKKPSWFNVLGMKMIGIVVNDKPGTTYVETMKRSDKNKWQETIDAEHKKTSRKTTHALKSIQLKGKRLSTVNGSPKLETLFQVKNNPKPG
uniref:Uncharacterized protein n=1 Tax=Bracon brevicornis TaxID=1563983 RepID=A0A6V7KR11_9HYME